MTRRDYTNAEGYICPTENSAVRNVDRGYTTVYTAPVKPQKTKVLKQKQMILVFPKTITDFCKSSLHHDYRCFLTMMWRYYP